VKKDASVVISLPNQPALPGWRLQVRWLTVLKTQYMYILILACNCNLSLSLSLSLSLCVCVCAHYIEW
jgi:hypothetical protein